MPPAVEPQDRPTAMAAASTNTAPDENTVTIWFWVTVAKPAVLAAEKTMNSPRRAISVAPSKSSDDVRDSVNTATKISSHSAMVRSSVSFQKEKKRPFHSSTYREKLMPPMSMTTMIKSSMTKEW